MESSGHRLIDLDSVVMPRPPAARPSRRALLAALTLVLAFSLGAAVPAARVSSPSILLAGFADRAFIDRDRLFVAGPGVGGRGLTLSTYRLPSAQPIARLGLGKIGAVSGVVQVGGIVLVTFGDPATTIALDAATGQRFWSLEGTVLSVAGGAALVSTSFSDGTGADLVVDLTTGATRWSVTQPLGGQITVAGLPDWAGLPSVADRSPVAGWPRWLLTTTAGGLVTAYDGRTGARLGSTTVPGLTGPFTYSAGDRFLIGTGPAGITALSLPGLGRIWHAPVDRRTDELEPDCVAVLCADLGQEGVAALDPVTGRTLWTSTRWSTLVPFGDGLLGAAGDGAVDGLPLVRLDPATGRARGGFGGWRAILNPDGSIRYAQHPGPAENSVYFGVLGSPVRLLGWASDVSGHIDVGSGAFVYHRSDGRIAVWPVV